MRVLRFAMSGLMLSVLGCSAPPRPKLTDEAKAAAQGVTIASLTVSDRELTAKAHHGKAAVALTLTPGSTNPLDLLVAFAMGMYRPGQDEPRPCTVRILDRDGELLREGGATVGVTETRSLEDFEADLKVAEGLAVLLSQNEAAWDLYRWELRDVQRTAHELQGLRGPTQ